MHMGSGLIDRRPVPYSKGVSAPSITRRSSDPLGWSPTESADPRRDEMEMRTRNTESDYVSPIYLHVHIVLPYLTARTTPSTQLYIIQMVANTFSLKPPRTKGEGLVGLGRTLEYNHFCSTTHEDIYMYPAFPLSLQHPSVSCCVSQLCVSTQESCSVL